MRFWHDFLDSFDSDGGKIFLLMVLMGIGFAGAWMGVPKAEDIIVGSFGALLIALKDSGSNKDRREGPPMPLPSSAGANSEPPVTPIVQAAVAKVAEQIKEE